LPFLANPNVNFDEFEQLASAEWERIPGEYKAGIDGLVIERKASAHPDLPDVYTLGECVTEAYPSDFGGPDTIRSSVVLYYGSFLRLSRVDQTFDWVAELWETLTHELQHHLESLAADEKLTDLDYAVDEEFKRREGEPFDPVFYRAGEALGDGWYRVEEMLYLERVAEEGDVVFELDKVPYSVAIPPLREDITFIDVTAGLPDDAPPVTLVLVRREGMRGLLRALHLSGARSVAERQARAERTSQ
jgi:hypothetical protein